MRAAQVAGCLLVAVCARLAQAQAGCFRTVAQALAQTGEAAAAGYRLAAVRRDALRGSSWATVALCAHPERPALLVPMQDAEANLSAAATSTAGAAVRVQAVHAGGAVRVLSREAMVRLESAGVALASAAAGEWVRVRMGEGVLLAGIVRADGTVELRTAEESR